MRTTEATRKPCLQPQGALVAICVPRGLCTFVLQFVRALCLLPAIINTMQSANVYEHANDEDYKYDETRFLGSRLRRTDEVTANCTAHKDTCVRLT